MNENSYAESDALVLIIGYCETEILNYKDIPFKKEF
jgi:hypothetical protein